jgi:hypothetical protein
MGQYYRFIILSEDKKEIILVINPHDFNSGAKLMEHAYINNSIMNTIEFLISPFYKHHKSRIVMAGDYADNESDSDMNLYRMSDNLESFQQVYKNIDINYIVNHTKKMFVDKTKLNNDDDSVIHPLSLLICEGNGRGGGDYEGSDYHLVGTWSRDVISMEFNKPDDYTELICEFSTSF